MKRIEKLIELLDLSPHPEGGYFKEIYRSGFIVSESALPEEYNSERNICTSIYYLLIQNDRSHFHQLLSDEIWHHYEGSSASIHIIDTGGNYRKEILGKNISEGEKIQVVIPKLSWFAAEVDDKLNYILLGCTVSPGFDFRDFRIGTSEELINLYPAHSELIKEFTTK